MVNKRLLIKKARIEIVKGKNKIISDFEKHLVDVDKSFHTKYGKIDVKDLNVKTGSKIVVGKETFIVLDPNKLDVFKKLKRGVQIITLKDIGSIISNAGITKDSRVLDAGSGSGSLSSYLAMICKEVVSYDKEERNVKFSSDNANELMLKNVIFKQGNIYEEIVEKKNSFDVMTLDVPEPWKALSNAKDFLVSNGILVCYIPNISQVQELVNNLEEDVFLVEKVIENVEREWLVDKKRSRPATKDHAHTAFIVFIRKII